MSNQVVLGKKYTDEISGVTGVATSRTEFLFGCVRVFLEPEGVKEDGSPKEGTYFDEQRLIEDSVAKAGGPTDLPPPSRPDPPK